MISKWYELKTQAIEYRLAGKSIREVESKFKIPKSTLSGWFKNIKLSNTKKKTLNNKWRKSLAEARKKAVVWHNKQKLKRIEFSQKEALETLLKLDTNNRDILELALSMLYLGEGGKNRKTTIGNTSPIILKFFIRSMERLYGINKKDIKCDLHLRTDQNIDNIKKYWSKQLNIPIQNFIYTNVDRRSLGKKSYKDYKGVCVLTCGNIAIQRKLVYLSNKYCESIYNK